MKKIIIMLLLCIVMAGCAKEPYTEITYKEYKTMIENKESFVLFIGQEDCSHCKDFKETLKEVVKNYKVNIKYIDIQKVHNKSEKDLNDFNASIIYSGTPVTVFIKNGEEESRYNRIEGSRSYDAVVEKLKQNGYIK